MAIKIYDAAQSLATPFRFVPEHSIAGIDQLTVDPARFSDIAEWSQHVSDMAIDMLRKNEAQFSPEERFDFLVRASQGSVIGATDMLINSKEGSTWLCDRCVARGMKGSSFTGKASEVLHIDDFGRLFTILTIRSGLVSPKGEEEAKIAGVYIKETVTPPPRSTDGSETGAV